MNKRHYEHTLPNIRGSLSNTYCDSDVGLKIHSFRRMFGQQSGHQSKRLKTGVCIQIVFQAHVRADG